MVAGDRSLPAGVVSAGSLFIVSHALTALIRRYPAVRQLFVGKPVMLWSTNGRLLEEGL